MGMQVNGRIIPKRIHVRVEHVKPSRCKEEFLKRSKENDEVKHEAKLRGGECLGCLATTNPVLLSALSAPASCQTACSRTSKLTKTPGHRVNRTMPAETETQHVSRQLSHTVSIVF